MAITLPYTQHKDAPSAIRLKGKAANVAGGKSIRESFLEHLSSS